MRPTILLCLAAAALVAVASAAEDWNGFCDTNRNPCPDGTTSFGQLPICGVCKPGYFNAMSSYTQLPEDNGVLGLGGILRDWQCAWDQSGSVATDCQCMQCPATLKSFDKTGAYPKTFDDIIPCGSDLSANNRCYCGANEFITAANATAAAAYCGATNIWDCYLASRREYTTANSPALPVCAPCPPFQVSSDFNSGPCTWSCPAGRVIDATSGCVTCPAKSTSSTPNSQTCTCTGNYVSSRAAGASLTCTCPSSWVDSGSGCSCGSNAADVAGSGVPSATNPCQCNANFTATSGSGAPLQCSCVGPYAVRDGKCQCPATSVTGSTAGTCVCAANAHLQNAAQPVSASNPCVCNDFFTGSPTNCQCASPFVLQGGQCLCPANSFYNPDTQTCETCGPYKVSSQPGNTVGSQTRQSCVCSSGFITQPDGTCIPYTPCIPANVSNSASYQVLALSGSINLNSAVNGQVGGGMAAKGDITLPSGFKIGTALPTAFYAPQTILSPLVTYGIFQINQGACLETQCSGSQQPSATLFAFFGQMYSGAIQNNAGKIPSKYRPYSSQSPLQFTALEQGYKALSASFASAAASGSVSVSGNTVILNGFGYSAFNTFTVAPGTAASTALAQTTKTLQFTNLPSDEVTVITMQGTSVTLSTATVTVTADVNIRHLLIFNFPDATAVSLAGFVCGNAAKKTACVILAPKAVVTVSSTTIVGQIIGASVASTGTLSLTSPTSYLINAAALCNGNTGPSTTCIMGGNCFAPDLCVVGACVKCECPTSSCQSNPQCVPTTNTSSTALYDCVSTNSADGAQCPYASPSTGNGCSDLGGVFLSSISNPANVPVGCAQYGFNFPKWSRDRSWYATGCGNLDTFFHWIVDGSVPPPTFRQNATHAVITGTLTHNANWRYQMYLDVTLTKAPAGTSQASMFLPNVAGSQTPFTLYSSASGTLVGRLYLLNVRYSLGLFPGTIAQIGNGANGINTNFGFLTQFKITTLATNDDDDDAWWVPDPRGVCRVRGLVDDDDDDCDWDSGKKCCRKGKTVDIATIRVRGDIGPARCSVTSGNGQCSNGQCVLAPASTCTGFQLTTTGVYQVTNNDLLQDNRWRSGLRCDGLFGGGPYQAVSFDFEYDNGAGKVSDVKLTWIYNTTTKKASMAIEGTLYGGTEPSNHRDSNLRQWDQYYIYFVIDKLTVSNYGYSVAQYTSADGGFIAKIGGSNPQTYLLKPSSSWLALFGLSAFGISNVFATAPNTFTAYGMIDHSGSSGHISDTAFSFSVGQCLGSVPANAYPFPVKSCPSSCLSSGVPVWSNSGGVLTSTSTRVVVTLNSNNFPAAYISPKPAPVPSFVSKLGVSRVVATTEAAQRLRLDIASSITALGSDVNRVQVVSTTHATDGSGHLFVTLDLLPSDVPETQAQNRFSSEAAATELSTSIELGEGPITVGLISSSALSSQKTGTSMKESCGNGEWVEPGQCASSAALTSEAIAGVVVGCAAAVAISAAVAVALRRRRQNQGSRDGEAQSSSFDGVSSSDQPASKRAPTATMIALMATRGEDVTAYITPRSAAAAAAAATAAPTSSEAVQLSESPSIPSVNDRDSDDYASAAVGRTASYSQSRSVTVNPPDTVESLVELQQAYDMIQSNTALASVPSKDQE